MRSLITLLLVMLFSSVAIAQDIVLVPQVPTFVHGEAAPAPAIMIFPNGARLEMHQIAQRGPDGQTYVLGSIVNSEGTVVGKILMNPRTFQSQSVVGAEKSKTISTTCTPELLYPIVLGKAVDCQEVSDINGTAVTSRMRFKANQVERDRHGRTTAYCGLIESEEPDRTSRGRFCFTPDGKWIRTLEYLEILERKRT